MQISKQAAREGRLREMFGCGTACVVQPSDGLVRASGEVIAAPWDAADPSSLTQRLTRALTDIQYGRWGPPLGGTCGLACVQRAAPISTSSNIRLRMNT